MGETDATLDNKLLVCKKKQHPYQILLGKTGLNSIELEVFIESTETLINFATLHNKLFKSKS